MNYSNNPIIGFEYELNHHGGILVSNDGTVSAKRSTMNFFIPSGITGNMNVFAVRENNGYYFYPYTNLTLMDKSYVQPGEDITFYASTSNIDNVSYIAKLVFIPTMSSRHDSQSLYANNYNPCTLEEEIILYKTDRNVSLNGENKIAFTYTVKDEDFLFKNQAIYVKLEYFVSE